MAAVVHHTARCPYAADIRVPEAADYDCMLSTQVLEHRSHSLLAGMLWRVKATP
jgi:hypothetical protein